MVMPRRWQHILLTLGGAMLATFGLVGAGEAANCGDTAGPFKTRVPCACGDTVVTNTRLRATDPVVMSFCGGFEIDAALVIGADNVTLDCAGRKIRGGEDETDLGLRGLLAERNRVTVKNCPVEFFFDGIILVGDRNRVIGASTFGTFGGILISGSRNSLLGSRASFCLERGFWMLGGSGNKVWNNEATDCFVGLVVESDKNSITWNAVKENFGPGLAVFGAQNLLIGNTASRNGEFGQIGEDDGIVVVGTGNMLVAQCRQQQRGQGLLRRGGQRQLGPQPGLGQWRGTAGGLPLRRSLHPLGGRAPLAVRRPLCPAGQGNHQRQDTAGGSPPAPRPPGRRSRHGDLADTVPARRAFMSSYAATMLRGLATTSVMVVLLAVGASAASAADCPAPSDTKPPTVSNFEITNQECKLGKGTYYVGVVNIHTKGVLRFLDEKIDFWANAILVEDGGSLLAGDAPPKGATPCADTDKRPIGCAGGEVTIHLYGKGPVNPTDPVTGPRCKLDRCGVPSDYWKDNPTAKVTLPGGITDFFYKYGTLPFDNGDTEAYYGTKVLGVGYGGTVKLFGLKGASYDDADVKPADAIKPSDSGRGLAATRRVPDRGSLQVADPRPRRRLGTGRSHRGHHHRLPPRPQRAPADHRRERCRVRLRQGGRKHRATDERPREMGPQRQVLSSDGRRHRAPEARDQGHAGKRRRRDARRRRSPVAQHPHRLRGRRLRPAVPVRDRDRTVLFGGHTIVRQGFPAYQVQGVEFYQLGQGGRIAHYPVHFHMAATRRQTSTFIQDCSVHDSMTRWNILHATHASSLARNVGYLSIGHGYYIEDGTEIENQYFSNIGIFARSAVDNAQNPRQVPGSCRRRTASAARTCPYHTDFDHPAVFWIMNGYNDFQYNMAAGAGACGACFWLVPGPPAARRGTSTGSRTPHPGQRQSASRDGAAQVVSRQLLLVGDELVQLVGNTTPCYGILDVPGFRDLPALDSVPNPLARTVCHRSAGGGETAVCTARERGTTAITRSSAVAAGASRRAAIPVTDCSTARHVRRRPRGELRGHRPRPATPRRSTGPRRTSAPSGCARSGTC